MLDSPESQEPQLKKSEIPAHQAIVDTQNQKAEEKFNTAGLTIQNKPGFAPLPNEVTENINSQSRDLTALAIRKQRSTEQFQKEREETEKLITTDPLSELHNYRWYTEEIVRQMAKTIRTGSRLWVAKFDLDNFKQVNEMYGHNVGDNILKAVKSLEEVSRIEEPIVRVGADAKVMSPEEMDDVARIGGEEFVQLIDENIDEEGISSLMTRQMEKLAESTALVLKNQVINEKYKQEHPEVLPMTHMTMSYGATELRYQTTPFEGATQTQIGVDENGTARFVYVESKEEFDKRADTAERYSKHNGKNRGTFAFLAENNELKVKSIPIQTNG